MWRREAAKNENHSEIPTPSPRRGTNCGFPRTKKTSMKPKPSPSPLRPFGEASLLSFFHSKSRQAEEEIQVKSLRKSISFSDFLDRKIGKSGHKSIQERKSAFGSIGSARADQGTKSDGLGNDSIIDKAVFWQIDRSTKGCAGEEAKDFQPEAAMGARDSRKRMNPFGVPSGDEERTSKRRHLVVLGDDPKPRQRRVEKRTMDSQELPAYNHYANGSGWWDGDREGFDAEEVGCSEVWEGLGSTTLGGLEWH